MRRATIVLLLASGLGGLLFAGTAHADYVGSGSPEISRLPWRNGAGYNLYLSTGWGGCTFAGTHCVGNLDEYAVDWADSPPANVWTLAAREGHVSSCFPTSTAGHVLMIDRSDQFYDRYVHLAGCPTVTHVEQGDFVAMADGSGTASDGIHLHFEKRDASGQTYTFDHSGLTNFCGNTAFCGGDWEGQFFTSDNAGPGAFALGDLWAQIRDRYMIDGHYGCGSNSAWNCFGSSIQVGWLGPAVFAVTLNGDEGYAQHFQTEGGANTYTFSRPNVCNEAYIIGGPYWWYWIGHTTIGHARSDKFYQNNPFLNGPGYYQYFRYGHLFSPTINGTPTFYSGLFGCT